jgi:phenylacetate-CoA ligase
MFMYNWVARNVLARTLDYARGTNTMSCLNALEKSQWWPKERVKELQNERLRKLIQYAYDNIPYYRREFDERALKPGDISCCADLRKLPTLNKKTIRRNFHLLQPANSQKKALVAGSTSGSTGEPLVFYSTKDDRYNWGYARAQRALSWSGYRLGDRIADFHAGLPNQNGLEKFINRIKSSFRKSLFIDPLIMSEESIPVMAKKLEVYRPEFLFGYPSAIYLMARYIQSKGSSSLKIKAVLTCDEQLYDYQRELFHKVFSCDTYSYYSAWEVFDIAGECAQHTGYHISAENVIVEITDEAGKPVPANVEGRILLTNLHNYAMPFIRYDIGDTGAISDVSCPCGRNSLPLLVNLSGRADTVILTRSGKQIPGRSIPQRFLATLGVDQYQIVQESYEYVVVKIVLDKEYPEDTKTRVIQKIQACYKPILGKEITLDVQLVHQISPAKSGKRAVFISKLST